VKLYLDDDICATLLVALLRKAGHDVVVPADLGMAGSHDAEHLLPCIREERVFLTKNYVDFIPIHHLVVGCSGSHTGVLLVREEDDRRKNMSYKTIVTAVGKVEQAYPDLTNELITLNDWR
jgi:predicted nuclease of predicted toxin-antitoxin system